MCKKFRAFLPQAAVFAVVFATLTIFAETSFAQQGSFVVTGNLKAARSQQHTATLLNNGTVLVAGGGSGNSILTSAELYDTATGTFTPTGSMILNGGMVLAVGGGAVTVVVTILLRPQQRRLRRAPVLALTVLLCVTATLTSCGGGSGRSGGPGTQAGTYTIAVTGSFSSDTTTLTHGANLTLVVQ